MATTYEEIDELERDELLDGLEEEFFGDAVLGEGGEVLQPLDSSRVSISGALGGSGVDPGRPFSEINARETEVRFEAEEAEARYWVSRLGKEGKEHVERADRLLDRWAAADLLQINIRRRRLKQGLAAVEHERARWHTATRKMDLFEELATQLPSAAYEYFQCRLEQYRILRERSEDRAKGIPTADFSDLIKRIQQGEAKPSEIAASLPWPILEALWVSMQDASPNNPHWTHTERMAASAAMANAKRNRSRFALNRGQSEDGDG